VVKVNEGGVEVLRDIISVGRLVKERRRALRKRVWFKALSRDERSIVSLTIRCVDWVQSAVLARIVMAILIKLKAAMESPVKRMVRTLGRSMAQRVSRIAQAWGNKCASQWAWDPGFIQYLAVMKMNTPCFNVYGVIVKNKGR